MTERLCRVCLLATLPGEHERQAEPRAFATVIEVAR
jgi:hypothetical protein